MTDIGDVVLIYHQANPTVFARIEAIEPDAKKDWYHVTLLFLTLPMQTVTWILRDVYINGEEFTMNGKPMRLEPVRRVEPRKAASSPDSGERNKKENGNTATVIPFKKP
ncbi:MAG: hypothetical protein K9M96_02610 [Deltaproteobacteria bacterium]|nr:hypothetical protein [Deltaproteobacteria bacterium]MCF8120303.1 hypothetical protein [Deltaproteobacteria bacterium]